MEVEFTLVINRFGRPLSPTRRTDMIRKKIGRGLARLVTWLHKGIRVVQFFERKYDNIIVTDRFGIAIDPGYKYIGWNVYKLTSNRIIVLFCGTFELETSKVTERMKERAMYRRIRRRHRRINCIEKFGRAKIRIPRWKNRKRTEKWMTPTGTYLIRNHVNLVRMFKKWLPINQVCIEYAMFDQQRMKNPNIHGWQYQTGPAKDFDHVRQYVLCRDKFTCQVCHASGIPLQVHHIVPRSQGGTDRQENLITVCPNCHQKIHNGEVICPKPNTIPLKPAGVLNSCMNRILEELELETDGEVLRTTGIDTKVLRRQYSLPKGHDIDALIIARNCLKLKHKLIYPDSVKLIKYRRHPSRAIVTRREDRKYYEVGSRKCVAKNRRKRTGQTFNSLQDYLKENRNHPPLSCLLYTSPSPRDLSTSRMPSSA